MQEILDGGVLVTHEAVGPVPRKAALSRRQRPTRPRATGRPVATPAQNLVQPGQLASPLLQFGFPSLSIH